MKQSFNSITPALIAQRKAVQEVCRQFSRSPSKGNLKRLKGIFNQCGEQVHIESGFHCDYGENILLGDRVYINVNCTIVDGKLDSPSTQSDQAYRVTIGDDCLIGPNVQLLSVSHDINPELRQAHKTNFCEAITLGKNVWLGGGVIVLSGVSIGDNSVIGAGSVVTKNVEPDCFYAGNPAIKIRAL